MTVGGSDTLHDTSERGKLNRSGNLWTVLLWQPAPHFVESETWESCSAIVQVTLARRNAVDTIHCADNSITELQTTSKNNTHGEV